MTEIKHDEIQLHIMAKPIEAHDVVPQVIIGFTSAGFSQAVYLNAPMDPADAVRTADALYKGFLEAAGAAVKEWNDAQSAGAQAEAGSV